MSNLLPSHKTELTNMQPPLLYLTDNYFLKYNTALWQYLQLGSTPKKDCPKKELWMVGWSRYENMYMIYTWWSWVLRFFKEKFHLCFQQTKLRKYKKRKIDQDFNQQPFPRIHMHLPKPISTPISCKDRIPKELSLLRKSEEKGLHLLLPFFPSAGATHCHRLWYLC